MSSPELPSSKLTDEEIDTRLSKAIEGERNIFLGWPMEMKRSFYDSLQVELPNPIKVTGNCSSHVKSSVIFDTTDEEKALASYHRAIDHYQKWQLAGSDSVFEFDKGGEKVWATRKDETFVFWYKYKKQEVGVVIDGQHAWIEGLLRRTLNDDGTYTYGTSLQFLTSEGRVDAEESVPGSSKRSCGAGAAQKTYIQDAKLQIVDTGGNYTTSVCDINAALWQLWTAIDVLSSYKITQPFKDSCGTSCDILILYSTEAGKNRIILQFTTHSLAKEGLHLELRLPLSLDASVKKHRKVTENALVAIGKKLQQPTADMSKLFETVEGAPFRTVAQCVEAYAIFRRLKCSETKFFLPSMKSQYHKQKTPISTAWRRRHGTTEESEQRVHEQILSQGTLFTEESHGGKGDLDLSDDVAEKYVMPLPSPLKRTKWYHYYPAKISD